MLENNEQEFKVGDRIQNVSKESAFDKTQGKPNNYLKFGTVISLYGQGATLIKVQYDDGDMGSGEMENYKLVNKIKKTFMARVSILAKKLLDADTQALIKGGFVDSDLDVTNEGTRQLTAILLIANKAAMVEAANAVIAENEKNKTE